VKSNDSRNDKTQLEKYMRLFEGKCIEWLQDVHGKEISVLSTILRHCCADSMPQNFHRCDENIPALTYCLSLADNVEVDFIDLDKKERQRICLNFSQFACSSHEYRARKFSFPFLMLISFEFIYSCS
jgi:hypothetical protein